MQNLNSKCKPWRRWWGMSVTNLRRWENMVTWLEHVPKTWERLGLDMIQKRSNSDFDVKYTTIQFYSNSYNSQSDRWIELQFYVESPDMLSYLGLKLQVNRCSESHRNTGQQRLHEFCYLFKSRAINKGITRHVS